MKHKILTTLGALLLVGCLVPLSGCYDVGYPYGGGYGGGYSYADPPVYGGWYGGHPWGYYHDGGWGWGHGDWGHAGWGHGWDGHAVAAGHGGWGGHDFAAGHSAARVGGHEGGGHAVAHESHGDAHHHG
jgi:hypothetical protein